MDGTIDVVFWIMSAAAIIGALLVVTVKDVFRAALALAGSFLAVAGIFFLLQAEFVAVAQILVYVGAISIVVAFAILLTRDIGQGNPT
ncbi:MAG: NADH-quinone oxidoreductase subunit L, partial [Chloroflexi bacterium]|nr:NADH-quinone oxidoreductase subunit L [Chloroflexota bacterium]